MRDPHRPTRFARLVLPGAFLVALAVLLAEAFGGFELSSRLVFFGLPAGPLVLSAGALSALGLLAASVRDPERAARLRREALLVPCVLAPLAVLSPWVIAPSHLGPSYASLPFFLAWLDRYPTMGPVNHEVLLGIGAVLGACALPALLAAHVAIARRPAPRVVIPLALLQLVAYLPVLVRLDAEILAYAAMIAREGPIAFLGPIEGPWWQDALHALMVGAGALLRALATLAMLAMVPLSLRAEEPLVVWEA